MIINPIAIATNGVYSNNISLGLASFGYIDLGISRDVGGNFAGFVQGLREDDELLIVINAFLYMRNL